VRAAPALRHEATRLGSAGIVATVPHDPDQNGHDGCARVLVVEDDDELRLALKDSLVAEGYEVATAANGAEALEVLRKDEEHQPSVILLDLMMPVMNGWQFITAQKDDPKLAGIPVVVLSAVGSYVQNVAPLDVAAFMRKPFELDALLETIHQHCAA
jgi:CheY-like chemotaxis protein